MALKRFLRAARDIQKNMHKPREVQETHGEEGAHDEGNWLISYADMMTLLCGFFIMLFSMSKLDEPQFEKVKEAVAKEFGGDYKSPTKDLARFITQVLEQNGLDRESTITVDPAGIAITFQSTIFFDTLSAELKPEGRKILDRLVASLKERQEYELKEYKIVVEGHTDSRPITSGDFPSNWELSGARSSRVIRLFLDHGFKPGLLTSIAFADTRPAFPSRTPAGALDEVALAKNRRVVIHVMNPKVETVPLSTPATTPTHN